MEKNFKFDKVQADKLRESISDFKNDTVKEVAENILGGNIESPDHSKAHVNASWEKSSEML
jgi:hypothetical protein